LKTKKKGSKPVQLKVAQLKVAKSKPTSASKSAKKPARRAPVSSSQSKQVPTKHVKAASAVKVSVAERLSTSRLVKTAAEVQLKTQKAALKLVTKTVVKSKGAVVVAKLPATKITRSEPTPFGSRVVTGNFGIETPVAKPVLAVRGGTAEKAVAKGVVQTVAASSVSFKSGDKIVYPGHGVGEIEGIRTTVLGGQEHHIYNIKIIDTGMKVMVPVSQASSVGLRKIVDKRAIDEVYAILKDRDFKIDTQTWNRRFREYSQKIKTGSVFEIAMVLRDLSVLSADKELSFGEKKMLDMAEALLVSEIAIAKARPHDKVAGELRALFA
jgi:CarD family transcriptional regulator